MKSACIEAMRSVHSDLLAKLQSRPSHIRNICILAHVDHGKTTLADTLIASNGIISQKMAGKLRYMDSLEEEQLRGITMKSSAISLFFSEACEHYLVNLIDSPGHIDFSSEVSTAVRLCDGAVIVVDAVEGVSAQTHAVLRQAWMEQIRPVLVINKIDRLILEMRLSPAECFTLLQQILEQVNAIMAQLHSGKILSKMSQESGSLSPVSSDGLAGDRTFHWDSRQHADENDDQHLYFSPDTGNVVFASALDGWGFGIKNFAKIYSEKLNLNYDTLMQTLWGDYYFNPKTKTVCKGAQAGGKKPLFVQMILDNVWSVYTTVCDKRDTEQTDKVVKALGVTVNPRDLKSTDGHVIVKAIMSQWLPISTAVLSLIVNHTPSPQQITEERVLALMCDRSLRFDSLHESTKALKQDFVRCSSAENEPVIVFVSKMCSVEKELFSDNQHVVLTKAELEQKHVIAKLRHEQREMQRSNAIGSDVSETLLTDNSNLSDANQVPSEPVVGGKPDNDSDYKFIAFARIFSGTIKKGQRLFVLGPKHNPKQALEQGIENTLTDSLTVDKLSSDSHVTQFTVTDLFTFMGRELNPMDEIPAGNILGIGGLEDHVLKSATISSTVACTPFSSMQYEAHPIVRVAIEPKNASDMAVLVKGMRLLNQADPCVQVLIQETGEHVLVTAGEVHMHRCCEDLRKRYAKVAINVSEPIVPFRETVVEPPTVDMVNEIIAGENVILKTRSAHTEKVVELTRGPYTISIEALPLAPSISQLIDTHSDLLQTLDLHLSGEQSSFSDQALGQLNSFREIITSSLKESLNPQWKHLADQIWAFGPRRIGPNLLINAINGYDRPTFWDMLDSNAQKDLREFDGAVVNGFQIATLSGPMCAEPLRGVAFVVRGWTSTLEVPVSNTVPDTCTLAADTTDSLEKGDDVSESSSFIASSMNSTRTAGSAGQLISCVKEACRRAFEVQPQRLMCAMYSCVVHSTAEVLGKVYGVLGKRNGRVLQEDMQEGTQIFNITAVLPVAESFGFCDEIRKKTSGLASPQLQFSHWEVIDVDPFWEPSTEEEMALYGEKYDSQNRAKQYLNQVRKRKGLKVEEKLVAHAEKQRTLTKNK